MDDDAHHRGFSEQKDNLPKTLQIHLTEYKLIQEQNRVSKAMTNQTRTHPCIKAEHKPWEEAVKTSSRNNWYSNITGLQIKIQTK